MAELKRALNYFLGSLPEEAESIVETAETPTSTSQIPENCRQYYYQIDLLVQRFSQHQFGNGKSFQPLTAEEVGRLPEPIRRPLKLDGRTSAAVRAMACSRTGIEISFGFETDTRRVVFGIQQENFLPVMVEDELFKGEWNKFFIKEAISWQDFDKALRLVDSIGRTGSP